MTKTTKKQTDEVEFDVMVADESHEKYVDTILDTIEIAARKRGSGIARRTHEYVAQKMREGKVIIALAGDCGIQLYRVVGKQTVRGYIGIDRGRQVPKPRAGQTHQTRGVSAGAATVAEGEALQSDVGQRRHEDEYRIGLRARHIQ